MESGSRSAGRVLAVAVAVAVVVAALVGGSTVSSAQSERFVALGDSVAAGAGLAPAAGAVQEDVVCGRSPQAYPTLLAADRGLVVDNLACTGAKVDDGVLGPQTRDGLEIAPQLDRAFEGGAPSLMTITVGGNDLRWSWFLRTCAVLRCGGFVSTTAAGALLRDVAGELRTTLQRVSKRSGGRPPRVLISGYYLALSDAASCADTEGLTGSEIRWLNTQLQRLNSTIETAARDSGFAEYVPVDITGHELCTARPWVQGRDAAQPFHPTADGQRALADAFAARL